MDKRRIFSASQKREIYFRADGLCELCGCDLEEEGWHAHHIERYADGGLTDTLNGMALCVPCHKEEHRNDKPIREESMNEKLKPRKAQYGALKQLRKSTGKDSLVELAAGVGKSVLAGLWVQECEEAGIIDIAVVMVPQNNTKSSYTEDWEKIGIRITDFQYLRKLTTTPPTQTHIIATYQSMSAVLKYVKAWEKNGYRVMVIFDEVHHLSDHTGDKEQNKWGENAENMAMASVKTLSLSATPFRHDGRKIKFLRYGEDGYAIADYRYAIADGIVDGVNKNIEFRAYDRDGTFTWVQHTKDKRTGASTQTERSAVLEEATEHEEGQIKKALFRRDSIVIKEMFRNAHDELLDIRAATNWLKREKGIVHCRSIGEMEIYAKVFEEETGQEPIMVHSNCRDPQEIINRFKDSDDMWMFCVDMVSEGCNIPRLTVGIFLKHMVSKGQFYQTSTRCCRIIQKGDYERAIIFMIAFRSHIDMALNIDKDIKEAIRITEQRGDATPSENTLEMSFRLKDHKRGSTVVLFKGEVIEDNPEEYRMMEKAISEIQRMKEKGAQRRDLCAYFKAAAKEMEVPTIKAPPEEERNSNPRKLADDLNEHVQSLISKVLIQYNRHKDKKCYAMGRAFIYDRFSRALGQEIRSIDNIRGDCTAGQIRALFDIATQIETMSHKWLVA